MLSQHARVHRSILHFTRTLGSEVYNRGQLTKFLRSVLLQTRMISKTLPILSALLPLLSPLRAHTYTHTNSSPAPPISLDVPRIIIKSNASDLASATAVLLLFTNRPNCQQICIRILFYWERSKFSNGSTVRIRNSILSSFRIFKFQMLLLVVGKPLFRSSVIFGIYWK
jgi:hypothetical protein